MAITAVLFLIWDEYFTKLGHWGFNDDYILGIKLGHLPLEEILFFICIPYACVFTYDAFQKLLPSTLKTSWAKPLIYFLSAFLFIVGLLNLDQAYTSLTFILTAVFLPVALQMLGEKKTAIFFIAYVVLLIPFFLVNGVLTGSWINEMVVWYNDSEHLGIRLGTIPIVDSIYMLLLLIMNTSLYNLFQNS